jgi:hypothetical protein
MWKLLNNFHQYIEEIRAVWSLPNMEALQEVWDLQGLPQLRKAQLHPWYGRLIREWGEIMSRPSIDLSEVVRRLPMMIVAMEKRPMILNSRIGLTKKVMLHLDNAKMAILQHYRTRELRRQPTSLQIQGRWPPRMMHQALEIINAAQVRREDL